MPAEQLLLGFLDRARGSFFCGWVEEIIIVGVKQQHHVGPLNCIIHCPKLLPIP